MEGSSKSVGEQYHVIRSISLPSRLHPASTKIETELNKLKASLSVASLISPETILNGLVGLEELYNCMEELLSPHTQQALRQYRNVVLVEADALEGSIGLLDSCGSLRDLLSLMKENVQDLQSALRRKGGDSSIQSHISTYFCSRKEAKGKTAKSLRALKQMEKKAGSSSRLPLDVDQHLAVVIRVIGEISNATISLFRPLFLFLSVSCTKTNRWSRISNLMMKRSRVSEGEEEIVNEIEIVDLALTCIHSKIDVQMTHKRLEKLDGRIECFEAGLDCFFRRLIRSRASLLNILTI